MIVRRRLILNIERKKNFVLKLFWNFFFIHTERWRNMLVEIIVYPSFVSIKKREIVVTFDVCNHDLMLTKFVIVFLTYLLTCEVANSRRSYCSSTIKPRPKSILSATSFCILRYYKFHKNVMRHDYFTKKQNVYTDIRFLIIFSCITEELSCSLYDDEIIKMAS